jgi:hypothetical protein
MNTSQLNGVASRTNSDTESTAVNLADNSGRGGAAGESPPQSIFNFKSSNDFLAQALHSSVSTNKQANLSSSSYSQQPYFPNQQPSSFDPHASFPNQQPSFRNPSSFSSEEECKSAPSDNEFDTVKALLAVSSRSANNTIILLSSQKQVPNLEKEVDALVVSPAFMSAFANEILDSSDPTGLIRQLKALFPESEHLNNALDKAKKSIKIHEELVKSNAVLEQKLQESRSRAT